MKKNLAIVIFLLSGILCHGEIIKPSKWKYTLSRKEVKVGETLDIIFDVTIDQDWYLYSTEFNPKLDAPHTEFILKKNDTYAQVGEVKAIGAKEKYDEIWEGNIKYFEHKAQFKITVKILKPDPEITVKVDGQVCSLKNGQCVPVRDEYEITGITVTAGTLPEKGSEGQDVKAEAGKEEGTTTAKATTTTSQTETARENFTNSKRVEELEAEKQKLVKADKEGKDETREYLKKFVREHK